MRYKVKIEMGNVGEYLPTTKYKIVLTNHNFRITEYKKADFEHSKMLGAFSEYYYNPNNYFVKHKTHHVIKNDKRNLDFKNDELLYHALYYIIQKYGYEALSDIPATAIPATFSEEFFQFCNEAFEKSKILFISEMSDKLSTGKLQQFVRKLELDYIITRYKKEGVVEYLSVNRNYNTSFKKKQYFDKHFYGSKLDEQVEEITVDTNNYEACDEIEIDD